MSDISFSPNRGSSEATVMGSCETLNLVSWKPNTGFLEEKEVLLNNADNSPSLKICGLKLSFHSLFPVIPYVGPKTKSIMT